MESGIEAHETRCVGRTVSILGRRARQIGHQLVRFPK